MDKNAKSPKATESNKSDRADLVIGILVILGVVALLVWLIASLSVDAKAIGSISCQGVATRGTTTTLNCKLDKKILKDGQTVTWIVDGKKVATTVYNSKDGLSLDYTPTHTGKTKVVAKCGDKYCGIQNIDVAPPQLTMEAPNITVTYGEKLPQLNYKCSGFVDDDCVEEMCYQGKCCVATTKLEVGSYPIVFDQECCYKDYNVKYVNGTLTVIPKEIQISGNFSKVYDQKTDIDVSGYTLKGVVAGDQVSLCSTKLHLENKDVGINKKIVVSNSLLCGKDAKNYTLSCTSNASITPKHVQLKGLTVQDKQYDGTTKVSLKQLGQLQGILPGDNVAIGSINVVFDNANVGKQMVVVKEISLVGLDKGNYLLDPIPNTFANITQR